MKFFLCVIGMVMIVEGLPWFAFPEKMKRMLAMMFAQHDSQCVVGLFQVSRDIIGEILDPFTIICPAGGQHVAADLLTVEIGLEITEPGDIQSCGFDFCVVLM